MISNKSVGEQIEAYGKELKLPGIRQNYKEISDISTSSGSSYEEFLLLLFKKEYELRIERRKQGRIRSAGFPCKKYIEDLDITHLPEDGANKLKMLSSLEFIKDGRNIVFSGTPGTGKTHLSIALGIKACLAGHRVLFSTVPSLVTALKESRSSRVLRSAENKFEKYDLVILDELGYISFDKEGAELLFTNLSLRAGRKSTIITTNLSFDRWNEIFHDPVLTAAMVDRLTHKAHLVDMNGSSYRMKETKEWIKMETKIEKKKNKTVDKFKKIL